MKKNSNSTTGLEFKLIIKVLLFSLGVVLVLFLVIYGALSLLSEEDNILGILCIPAALFLGICLYLYNDSIEETKELINKRVRENTLNQIDSLHSQIAYLENEIKRNKQIIKDYRWAFLGKNARERRKAKKDIKKLELDVEQKRIQERELKKDLD